MMAQASEPIDVLSLAGLGAELWQTVDVDAYLELACSRSQVLEASSFLAREGRTARTTGGASTRAAC